MAVVDYWNLLMEGKFVEAILTPYYDIFGLWIYVWLFGMSLLMLYGKTRNYGTVGIVGLIIAGHVFPILPPVVHLFAYILLAISITVILYKLYH